MKNKTLPLHSKDSYAFERVSVSAFTEASITVEAAMAAPVFFLAVVSLLYLMEIMAVQTAMRCGQYLRPAVCGKEGGRRFLYRRRG